MKQFCTYVHLLPDLTPFYIGKGSIGRAHSLNPRARNAWHGRKVAKYGAENIIIEKIICRTEAEAFLREQLAIKAARRAGLNLTNMTDGGEGMSGYIWSEEMRMAQSERAKKQMSDPEMLKRLSLAHKGQVPFMAGRKHTEETRAKIAANPNCRNKGFLGKKHTEESKAKNSASKKAQYANDPDLRKRLSAANLGKKYSEERLLKKRALMQTPEYRAKMSASHQNMSPETRAKMSAAAKRRHARQKENKE